MGPAAALAAAPGAAVPATTAGAALRAGASKSRRTHLGLEGPGTTRRGWGPETWERGVCTPILLQRSRGGEAARGQLGLGKSVFSGGCPTHKEESNCLVPKVRPSPTPCPPTMTREQRAFSNTPLFCLRPAYQPGAHCLGMAQESTVGSHFTFAQWTPAQLGRCQTRDLPLLSISRGVDLQDSKASQISGGSKTHLTLGVSPGTMFTLGPTSLLCPRGKPEAKAAPSRPSSAQEVAYTTSVSNPEVKDGDSGVGT